MKFRLLFCLLVLFISAFHLNSKAQETNNPQADALFEAAQQKSRASDYVAANLDYESAAKLYEKDKLWQRYIGCFNGKGWNLVLEGKFDEAINIFNDAIRIGTEKLGEKNTAVGMAYNNRATANMQMLRYEAAAADFNKTIDIWTPLLGADNQNVLFANGNLGMLYDRQGNFDAAIGVYNRILPTLTKTLGEDNPEVANLYNAIGVAYAQKGQTDKAIEYQDKALTIRKKNYGENSKDVAETYRNMGYACLEGSRPEKAISFFEKALQIHKQLYGENHQETARSYAGLASAYSDKPDYIKAESLMLKAIDIQLKKEGETTQLAINYSKLGIIYAESGNNNKAVLCFEKALTIDTKLLGKNHPEVADDYTNLGTFYIRRNNHIKAAEYLAVALQIQIATLSTNDVRLAHTLTQLGLVFMDELKYKEAADLFDKGLQIRLKEFGEKNMRVAASYHNLGTAYYSLKEYDKAQDYFEKAADIKKSLLGAKHLELEGTYNNLGRTYGEHKKYDKALKYFELSRQTVLPVLGEKSVRMASVYRNMANVEMDKKDYKKAAEHLQKALISAIKPFNSNNIYDNPAATQLDYELEILRILNMKGECLEEIYKQSNQQKDVQAAFAIYQLAIEELIGLRASFDTEYMRIYIGNVGAGLYEKALRTARKLERITQNPTYLYQAMAIAEKSKAGTLLNAMQDANALKFAGLPPEIIEKENQLKNLCDYLSRQMNEHSAKNETLDSASLIKAGVQLVAAKQSYRSFLEQIEKDYPRYYALRYGVKNTDIQQIKAKILSPNDVLIEYFVGKDSIYAFAANTQIIRSFVVPQDELLNYEIGLLRKQIADEKALRLYPTFKNYTTTAYNLYDMLLAPFKDMIAGKNLIIIPDKVLNQLPFEVLLTEEVKDKNQDYSNLNYLIKSHNIKYCSSAAILAELGNSNKKEAPSDYIAFAPVFSEGSGIGKVRNNTGIFRPAPASETSTRGYMRSGTIAPIPETATEVNNIKTLFEQKQKKTAVHTFAEAHEDKLKGLDLTNYKFVHFATHGFCSDKSVSDASGIILSQEGNTNEDGVLYAGEVYGLQLNARLVVLSACETGLGKEVSGEGLMGLARGFFHAGASGVVVSLWQVADQSTSQLMTDFFSNTLNQKSNEEALRQAKLSMIKKPETASPFFWAPFILQGK